MILFPLHLASETNTDTKTCHVLCSYLKDPTYPVWVVCSESHFTVLYGVDSHTGCCLSTVAGSKLNLMYYDGLANQDQPIKLTLSATLQPTSPAKQQQIAYKQPSADDPLVPPLEHVLHTKWPNVDVSWNGFEPIL